MAGTAYQGTACLKPGLKRSVPFRKDERGILAKIPEEI